MSENAMSFYARYKEILDVSNHWCYYDDMFHKVNRDRMFEDDNAKEVLGTFCKHKGKEYVAKYSHYSDFQISSARANHTVSAFLFGILLKDKLDIEMKPLPERKDNPQRNFLYFWSLICLFHDYAMTIEEKSHSDGKLREQLNTLDEFKKYFKIQYSLLDKSSYKELIENYYKYRIKKCHVVDHGIAAAMLLYNQMMTEYNIALKNRKNKSEPWVYSDNFETNILLIANVIARHNMWVADEKTIKIYKKYELDELILDGVQHHKITLNKESAEDRLLYLLGLIDTLDPVKNISDSLKLDKTADLQDLLKTVMISFDQQNHCFMIRYPSAYTAFEKRARGIEKWLGVSVTVEGKTDEEYRVLKFKIRENNAG